MNQLPPVIVVGAGTMGTGIAQVALKHGHEVHLVDRDSASLSRAAIGLVDQLAQRSNTPAATWRQRLHLASSLDSLELSAQDVPLLIEAIVEDLAAKQQLLTSAQEMFGDRVICATNTSSLSVTRIAAGVPFPERVVGMHFFNPVPVMRLVEIIPAVQTHPDVVTKARAIAESWDKTCILATSTPGFIVNRVIRPFYGEALRLAEEQTTSIDTIDRALRESAHFRMGPFELMDLVGNDVNHTVTRSIWSGHAFDPRFVPSNLQAELVAAGRLGRKSGRGYYDYADGVPKHPRSATIGDRGSVGETLNDAVSTVADRLGLSAGAAGDVPGSWVIDGVGTVLVTRGHTAAAEAAANGTPTLVLDRAIDMRSTPSLAFSISRHAGELEALVRTGATSAGLTLLPVGDVPGLISARVVSMLVNEAAEVVHLGLCSRQDVDVAMQLATNFPLGLMEWADRWGSAYIDLVVTSLHHHYLDSRYRPSHLIRQASVTGRRLAGAS